MSAIAAEQVIAGSAEVVKNLTAAVAVASANASAEGTRRLLLPLASRVLLRPFSAEKRGMRNFKRIMLSRRYLLGTAAKNLHGIRG